MCKNRYGWSINGSPALGNKDGLKTILITNCFKSYGKLPFGLTR